MKDDVERQLRVRLHPKLRYERVPEVDHDQIPERLRGQLQGDAAAKHARDYAAYQRMIEKGETPPSATPSREAMRKHSQDYEALRRRLGEGR